MHGYMDARATQHMTPQRNWFHDYISFVTLEMMYLARFDKVEGHEYVIFKFPRKVVTYTQNIHSPKLCKNLISINQVFDTWYKLELHNIHLFLKTSKEM